MLSDSEEENNFLEASETESDVESDDGTDSETETNAASGLSTEEKVRKKISEKYEKLHGKQLFVRFPKRLPEDGAEFQKKAKALSPLIVAAHKPRQKYARFCLVEFSSQSDRDTAHKSIRAAVKKDEAFKGIVALIPRTESEEFVNEMINKKLKSIEAKKAKARLKWAAKRAKRSKEYTSMIVVHNLPSNVSMIEMRKMFPNAVDIQLRPQGGKKQARSSIASITLPSTMDAREAVKKKISLAGTHLSIHFDFSRVQGQGKSTVGAAMQQKKQNDTHKSKEKPTTPKSEKKPTKSKSEEKPTKSKSEKKPTKPKTKKTAIKSKTLKTLTT